MSHAPTVSVVIPAYNRADTLAEALNSILGQSYSDYDVWVVDDGSVDDTRDIVAGCKDGRIRYAYQANAGCAAARNTGVALSQGRYLAFLDSDDVAEPSRLSAQVRMLDAAPNVCAVFSDVVKMLPDGSWRRFSETLPGLRRAADTYGAGSSAVIPAAYMYRLMLHENPAKPSTLMVRRNCLPPGPTFDATLVLSETFDLLLRLTRRYAVAYIDEPLVRLRVWPGSLHLQQIECGHRTAIRVLERQARTTSLGRAYLEVRRSTAMQRWMLGCHYWNEGRATQAAAELIRAYCTYPNPAFLLYGIGALLPPTVLATAKSRFGALLRGRLLGLSNGRRTAVGL